MERGPEEVVLRAVRLPEDMPGLFDRIEAFGPARLGCGDAMIARTISAVERESGLSGFAG